MNSAGDTHGKALLCRIFLLIAPLLYATYALITPPFQTPDEHQHLFRAWQLSEFQLFAERRGDELGGFLPDSLAKAAVIELGLLKPHTLRFAIELPVETRLNRRTPIGDGAERRFLSFPGSAIYSPAGYVPQVAAIWLGKALGLSVEAILRLGRLANAALAIGLIYWAMRVTPVGAVAMLWVGLLPMTASASAAFGQDGLIIGGACLLTAIGLRVIINGGCSRLELLAATLLTILLTISKLFYLPLALISAPPFFLRNLGWRRSALPLLVCLAAAGLTAIWLNSDSVVMVPLRDDMPPASERLDALLHTPTEFLMMLPRTYGPWGKMHMDQLFTFGWLTVGPVDTAMTASFLALAMLLYCGNAGPSKLDWQSRLWLLAIAASIGLLISLAFYLVNTPVSENYIRGLQARYFIPIIPAILVAALPNRDRLFGYALVVPALMLAANILALGAIGAAYYR
jgi:uncharacterized membrane protein